MVLFMVLHVYVASLMKKHCAACSHFWRAFANAYINRYRRDSQPCKITEYFPRLAACAAGKSDSIESSNSRAEGKMATRRAKIVRKLRKMLDFIASQLQSQAVRHAKIEKNRGIDSNKLRRGFEIW